MKTTIPFLYRSVSGPLFHFLPFSFFPFSPTSKRLVAAETYFHCSVWQSYTQCHCLPLNRSHPFLMPHPQSSVNQLSPSRPLFFFFPFSCLLSVVGAEMRSRRHAVSSRLLAWHIDDPLLRSASCGSLGRNVKPVSLYFTASKHKTHMNKQRALVSKTHH